MNIRKLTMLLLLAACACGCYSVQTASSPTLASLAYANEEGEVASHVFVSNCGWYLFYGIPLCSGNPSGFKGVFPLSFFTDNVNADAIQKGLADAVRKQYGAEARLVAVSHVNEDFVRFSLPGFSIPIIIPYVLCARTAQICATVLRPHEPKKEDEP